MARQYLVLGRSFDIAITADDILHGLPVQAAHDPIALACKRALGLPADSTDVSVMGDGWVRVWSGAETRDFDLGEQSQVFCERFDLGLPVEPATFRAVSFDRIEREREAA